MRKIGYSWEFLHRIEGQMFEDSAIVAAHPDDEALWFSSVLAKVDQVILCYVDADSQPAWPSGRRKSIADYPLPNVSTLELRESGVFMGVDWRNVEETEYGLAITEQGFSDARYRENYARLLDELGNRLAGLKNVFTHNPWGEYGHVEHVQVYRAVRTLQPKLGFDLWFSTYFSQETMSLMDRSRTLLEGDKITLSTDKTLARRIADLYKANDCWTWYDDYEWCDAETFVLQPIADPAARRLGAVCPLNFISVEMPARPRPAPGLFETMLRRLKKVGHAIGLRSGGHDG